MNFLLIQLKRIGDLILTTPAIAALRRHFPDAGISLVVARGGKELLPMISGIDWATTMRGNVRDAGKWFSIARGGFEACIDFTHNDRSASLTLLSRARRRITAQYVELQSKLRARSYTELVPCSMRTMHTIDYHLSLLEPLGIRDASREIQLNVPADALRKCERLLREANVDGEFVLLHPGSARAEKFWEPQHWADVIAFVREELRLPCIVTGSMSATEQNHLAEIKRAARYPIIDFSGKTNLRSLAALVQRARLLVTVDSAPMHFAAAFHTPVVAMFGPTNPFHWRPLTQNAVVIQGENAEPVTQFVPKQTRLPMNAISTRAVIGAMETLLSAPAASRYE